MKKKLALAFMASLLCTNYFQKEANADEISDNNEYSFEINAGNDGFGYNGKLDFSFTDSAKNNVEIYIENRFLSTYAGDLDMRLKTGLDYDFIPGFGLALQTRLNEDYPSVRFGLETHIEGKNIETSLRATLSARPDVNIEASFLYNPKIDKNTRYLFETEIDVYIHETSFIESRLKTGIEIFDLLSFGFMVDFDSLSQNYYHLGSFISIKGK
jgi:hypothetical protein